MQIQNFPYLAFPVTFKTFLRDLMPKKSNRMQESYITVSFQTVSESNFPFQFIVMLPGSKNLLWRKQFRIFFFAK